MRLTLHLKPPTQLYCKLQMKHLSDDWHISLKKNNGFKIHFETPLQFNRNWAKKGIKLKHRLKKVYLIDGVSLSAFLFLMPWYTFSLSFRLLSILFYLHILDGVHLSVIFFYFVYLLDFLSNLFLSFAISVFLRFPIRSSHPHCLFPPTCTHMARGVWCIIAPLISWFSWLQDPPFPSLSFHPKIKAVLYSVFDSPEVETLIISIRSEFFRQCSNFYHLQHASPTPLSVSYLRLKNNKRWKLRENLNGKFEVFRVSTLVHYFFFQWTQNSKIDPSHIPETLNLFKCNSCTKFTMKNRFHSVGLIKTMKV